MDEQEEKEPEPLMVLHLYREDNGDLFVSEQRFFMHGIHPTQSRKQAFRDFWQMLEEDLDFLERYAHELGWSLTENLAYLRRLREVGILSAKKQTQTIKKKK